MRRVERRIKIFTKQINYSKIIIEHHSKIDLRYAYCFSDVQR